MATSSNRAVRECQPADLWRWMANGELLRQGECWERQSAFDVLLYSRAAKASLPEEADQRWKAGRGAGMESRTEVAEARKWFVRLIEANGISGRYHDSGLRRAIGFCVAEDCAEHGESRLVAMADYWRAPMRAWHTASAGEYGVWSGLPC